MATAEAKQEALAAPEPVAPEAAARTRPKEIKIDLDVAVPAYGEMLKQLTFRRPTGGDIMALGELPVNINWQTGQVTPNKLMGQMMSMLANVPDSTVKALDSNDWTTCAFALVGFFTPGAQAMQS